MKPTTLAALLFAASAFASEIPCDPPGNQRAPCVPPATYAMKSAANPDPFAAPVRFGGEEIIKGRVFWKWVKAGDGPTCTAAQRSEQGAYGYACAANIGDVLYITGAFRKVP